MSDKQKITHLSFIVGFVLGGLIGGAALGLWGGLLGAIVGGFFTLVTLGWFGRAAIDAVDADRERIARLASQRPEPLAERPVR